MSNKNVEAKKEYRVRSPIVTVLGHVDHGKTSILDAIRNTRVQQGEYGGITQHIGAYQIERDSKKITFIDTPGHAAFMQMRARGGKVADIIVLVVAADEGVKPQTREAIAHTKASGADIIVAINKIDKVGADVNKVKQELAQEGIIVEDWGGSIVSVELSAKTGENLDKLLDAILATAEMRELKYEVNGELEAVIIEAKRDRRRGVVVTCIVCNGELCAGTRVLASGHLAIIKSITDNTGKKLSCVRPTNPVEILGFKEVPNVGDLMLAEGSELAPLA